MKSDFMILKRYPFYNLIEKSIRHIFWRDVKPKEVYQMVQICYNYSEKKPLANITKEVKNKWWKDILSKRYSTDSKDGINSYLLNYSLFFDHLLLWDENGQPEKNLYFLYNSSDEKQFLLRLQFLILTTGQLLHIIDVIEKIQTENSNGYKNKDEWLDNAANEIINRFDFMLKKSMIKDEIRRYFPGLFNTFKMRVLDDVKFNKSKGYGINLAQIDYIMLNGLFGNTEICDYYLFCKKLGYIK